MFSTSPGDVASDGSGKRNSPFAEAFLQNMDSTDDIVMVSRTIARETMEATNNRQRPYQEGSIINLDQYSLNPNITMPSQKPAVRQQQTDNSNKLWSVGISAGSAFTAPWLVGTVRGTIAPFNNSFLEIGFDYGMISGDPQVGYYTIYPYAHYAFYIPLGEKFALYSGVGGGYILGEYDFPEGKVGVNIFTMHLTAGFNMFDVINLSYTFRTNFDGVSNKVSIGYMYRFK